MQDYKHIENDWDIRQQEARNKAQKNLARYVLYALKGKPMRLRDFMRPVDYALLAVCMKNAKGNQSKVSRLLGVSRNNLRARIKDYFGEDFNKVPSENTLQKNVKLHDIGAWTGNAVLELVDAGVIGFADVLAFAECSIYLATMILANGDQTKSAKLLGVSRCTLRVRLRKYFGTTHVGRVRGDRAKKLKRRKQINLRVEKSLEVVHVY